MIISEWNINTSDSNVDLKLLKLNRSTKEKSETLKVQGVAFQADNKPTRSSHKHIKIMYNHQTTIRKLLANNKQLMCM